MLTKTKNIFLKYHSYLATKSRGVHVEKSALAIHFLFIGVSRVTGRMATAVAPVGRPDPGPASDCVNWCTAALAIPYPIIPAHNTLLLSLTSCKLMNRVVNT